MHDLLGIMKLSKPINVCWWQVQLLM